MKNRWTRKGMIAFGVLIGTFGAVIVVASISAMDQLYQAEGLCTSTPSGCVGTLSGASVYSNVHNALQWDILVSGLGAGTTAGGFVLAFNGARTKAEVASPKPGQK